MKRIWKWIIIAVLATVISYYVIVTIVDACLMGVATPSFAFDLERTSYMIEDSTRVDAQTDFKCSAFSSAYVMRHFGKDAVGDSVYETIPHKMEDGYVYPKGITEYLESKGFDTEYHIGNLTALKNAVSKGHPVIVMIRIRPDRDWLHYVPVVGYSADSIYIAESLPELCNANGANYTRRISTSDFETLWDTSAFRMPLYRNTFIVVSKEAR